MIELFGRRRVKSPRRVWIQALHHAREWITGSSVQYVVEALLAGYARGDVQIRKLLDSGVEFIIVPIANPDGYEYTRTKDRLWRKNRAIVKGTVQGVDLNRNWPIHWADDDSNTDPSKEIYRGPSAASEPETRALIRAFERFPGIVGALDVHSYSQQILWPYGYTTEPSVDEDGFSRVSTLMSEAILRNSGAKYEPARGSKHNYVTGGAKDWWYDTHGAWGLTVELAPLPDDDNGFELDPKFIRPVGSDAMQAVLAFAKFCQEHVTSKYETIANNRDGGRTLHK
jgi:murein tripeptide amidase MpaA